MKNLKNGIYPKKKISILYVEDDLKLGIETKKLLETNFQTVDYAYDGLNGLELYEQFLYENGFPYDLVITDIKMPRMCGLQLTKEIFKKNKTQNIVVISSVRDANIMIELINVGTVKFVEKPFHWKKLIEVLDELFEKIVDKNIYHDINLGGDLVWNQFEKKLKRNNELVTLSYNQTIILDLFVKNPNTLFSDTDLFVYIENKYPTRSFSKNAIKSIIKRLREKLQINIIKNIYGEGYQLVVNH